MNPLTDLTTGQMIMLIALGSLIVSGLVLSAIDRVLDSRGGDLR